MPVALNTRHCSRRHALRVAHRQRGDQRGGVALGAPRARWPRRCARAGGRCPGAGGASRALSGEASTCPAACRRCRRRACELSAEPRIARRTRGARSCTSSRQRSPTRNGAASRPAQARARRLPAGAAHRRAAGAELRIGARLLRQRRARGSRAGAAPPLPAAAARPRSSPACSRHQPRPSVQARQHAASAASTAAAGPRPRAVRRARAPAARGHSSAASVPSRNSAAWRLTPAATGARQLLECCAHAPPIHQAPRRGVQPFAPPLVPPRLRQRASPTRASGRSSATTITSAFGAGIAIAFVPLPMHMLLAVHRRAGAGA